MAVNSNTNLSVNSDDAARSVQKIGDTIEKMHDSATKFLRIIDEANSKMNNKYEITKTLATKMQEEVKNIEKIRDVHADIESALRRYVALADEANSSSVIH